MCYISMTFFLSVTINFMNMQKKYFSFLLYYIVFLIYFSKSVISVGTFARAHEISMMWNWLVGILLNF